MKQLSMTKRARYVVPTPHPGPLPVKGRGRSPGRALEASPSPLNGERAGVRGETRPARPLLLLPCLVAFCLCASLPALAQGQGQRPAGAGAGGLGGGGAGGGRAVGATGARPYYNNGTVGEAMISSDPETRRLIVITDDETGQYVSQVITNLDRPQPQVLIKVVFLEVTHNDSLDVGIEGGFQRSFGNMNTGTVANAFGLSGLNLPAGTNA